MRPQTIVGDVILSGAARAGNTHVFSGNRDYYLGLNQPRFKEEIVTDDDRNDIFPSKR